MILGGPLQSWGASSRFDDRHTTEAPTKSGVIGMIAAAQGVDRSDSITHLLRLRFGVRLDQPGTILRDFQTRALVGVKDGQVSNRYYLQDAKFLVAIEGPDDLLDGIAHALRHPTFPLYLGRRSCPPAGPILPQVTDQSLTDALTTHPWVASVAVQRSHRTATVDLEVLTDASAGDVPDFELRDLPVSFAPEHRQYQQRQITRSYVPVLNPTYIDTDSDTGSSFFDEHDPFLAL